MKIMSPKARIEAPLRLFKDTVLILSLFATQAIVCYFSARNVGSDHGITHSDSTARIQSVEIAYNRRKLLEVDESSNSSGSIIFLNVPWQNLSSTEKNCDGIHHFNSSEEKCQYIRATDACQLNEGFVQYLRFPYCSFPCFIVPGFFILGIWMVFLFVTVATIADKYFCQCLTVIANLLRMSENVAGVTILAYGNGTPEIFSSLVAFTQVKGANGVPMGIQSLFGSSVFLVTVCLGIISFMPPFTVDRRPFFRDVFFFLGAVAWCVVVLHDRQITLRESLVSILIYIVYALVVIVGHYAYERWKQKSKKRTNPVSSAKSAKSSVVNQVSKQHDWRNEIGKQTVNSKLALPCVTRDPAEHDAPKVTQSDASLTTENDAVLAVQSLSSSTERGKEEGKLRVHFVWDSPFGENIPLLGGERRISELEKFLNGLKPIDRENWRQHNLLWKCFYVFKAPAVLCLNLTIPVVDYSQQNHNWNKWLNVLHCVTVPVFCVMATQVGTRPVTGCIPAWALTLCTGLIVALVVAIVTENEQPPRGHCLFAFMAFVVSVIWIYCAANEIVNLIQSFCIGFGLSDAIVGLTFLAWGTSICDTVANIAVARRDYPCMAVSACFGEPLLNILLGIGLPGTFATLSQGGAIILPEGYHQYIVSAAFLATSLTSSAIVIPLLGFRVPRMFGVYLMVLYVAYLVVSITAEVMHI